MICKTKFIVLFLMVRATMSTGQGLVESPLPIIEINTSGQNIVDEPKVAGQLTMYFLPSGDNNSIRDQPHFQGRIGIELRGQTSQSIFPKKSFGIETWDSLNEDVDTTLLGMPSESDWVIHSPYSDKSLIRNALAYSLAADIMPYAPRTILAEMILNGDYHGVVLWTEKIKRSKHRIDIANLKSEDIEGDELTGGYIVKFDKGQNFEIGWTSPYEPIQGRPQRTNFLLHDPKANKIQPVQRQYINNYITEFEDVLASEDFDDPVNGYIKYIDVASFVQLIMVNELTRNVDGYRLSTFMYKDKDSKGGKLTMGPVWDYNLAFGNADYCRGSSISGWAYDFNEHCPDDFWVNHFWWKRLLEDDNFKRTLSQEWDAARQNVFSTESIFNRIDSLASLLEEPQKRNFERWPVLGTYIWPNNFIGSSYEDEINYLKDWTQRRLAWLDDNFGSVTTSTDPAQLGPTLLIYPNPSRRNITISFPKRANLPDRVEIFNSIGELVQKFDVDQQEIQLDLSRFQGQSFMVFRFLKANQIIGTNKILLISD